MATAIVDRTDEFEDDVAPSSLPSSTATVVAMVACDVILLVMLAACSPPAHAGDLARPPGNANTRVAVPLETITVTPAPEDRPSPVKGRWQRFEETLNAGARIRHARITESVTNDGIRTSCREGTYVNSCISSGGFSLAGAGFGR